jgi:hypothetical protein
MARTGLAVMVRILRPMLVEWPTMRIARSATNSTIDRLAAVARAQTDQVQARVVAESDLAVAVDGVVAHAEVHRRRGRPWSGLKNGWYEGIAAPLNAVMRS